LTLIQMIKNIICQHKNKIGIIKIKVKRFTKLKTISVVGKESGL